MIKITTKTLKAFSLIELMVSLITISCIAAAFSPIISKKLSMSSIMVSKPSGGSGGDSSGTCPLGQYMSSTTNTCTNCSDTFENCSICTESECLVCKSGLSLNAGKCEVGSCPPYTIKVTADDKDLCVTQYNMGDKTEFPVNVSGVKVVSTNRNCSANACCWRGQTADPSYCDSENGGYSGCKRTVCTQYAAEIICNSLNYYGLSWRLPTKDELAGFDPTAYSINKGTSGLMLCDGNSGYGSAQCSNYDVCDGSDNGYCYPYDVWSSTLYSSSDAYYYYLGVGSWGRRGVSRLGAYSVRCVSAISCANKFGSNCTDCSDTACTTCNDGYVLKDGQCKTCSDDFGTGCTSCSSSACTACSNGYALKNGQCKSCPDAFGSNCTSCSSSACTACSNGYALKNGQCKTCPDAFGSNCTSCSSSACTACKEGYAVKDGQCIVNPCPANTVYVYANGKDFCVTQYNMGDKTEFPVNVSGVTVVSTNSNCSENACCWQGRTSDSGKCDLENCGYSGCKRTVCTHYAAEIICNSLNYGGLSWRLPTKDELAGFDLDTYSINKGASGLMLCDRNSDYGSAQCDNYDVCGGSFDGSCRPYDVWSSTLYSSSSAYSYYLSSGSWNQNDRNRRYARSVRCVSNIGCANKFGSNCLDCSDSACTTCKEGYVVKDGQCKTCPDAFGSNCTDCSDSACTACKEGYVVKDGQCVVAPTCPPNTIKITADGKDFCVTQYNMGDKTEFPVNVSGVAVVSTNSYCSADACCWQGMTAQYYNSVNGGYSGGYRTVCTQYAAEIICNSLTYYGLSWRLPTSSEFAGFSLSTYSINKGASGLMLCDEYSGYGSAQCDSYNVCRGAYGGDCYPYGVWGRTFYDSSGSYCNGNRLSSGIKYHSYYNSRSAFSVRCVSEL